jgi:hypothetical protein
MKQSFILDIAKVIKKYIIMRLQKFGIYQKTIYIHNKRRFLTMQFKIKNRIFRNAVKGVQFDYIGLKKSFIKTHQKELNKEAIDTFNYDISLEVVEHDSFSDYTIYYKTLSFKGFKIDLYMFSDDSINELASVLAVYEKGENKNV